MRNLCLLYFFALLVLNPLQAQKHLLDDQETRKIILDGLGSIYNFEFEKAEVAIQKVAEKYPVHPVVPMMKGLFIYWKYYPLTPENTHSDEFIEQMEKCMDQSKLRLEIDEKDIEGIFFDLFGRAFYVMYWADNGKPRKVLPYLSRLYNHTVSGFDLKEELNEFYFTTGLYNYYIEAYPEKHPGYKALTRWFKEGDKALGLKQLKYCANNSIFIKAEARFFLYLLFLNYEKDYERAIDPIKKLHETYPGNILYLGEYIKILLLNEDYEKVPYLLNTLKKSDYAFSQMQFHLYYAYYLEKKSGQYEKAKREYQKGLKISEKFDDFTETFRAYAYMGLGRYYARKGNDSEARDYFDEAKDATSYEYVLNDR